MRRKKIVVELHIVLCGGSKKSSAGFPKLTEKDKEALARIRKLVEERDAIKEFEFLGFTTR